MLTVKAGYTFVIYPGHLTQPVVFRRVIRRNRHNFWQSFVFNSMTCKLQMVNQMPSKDLVKHMIYCRQNHLVTKLAITFE